MAFTKDNSEAIQRLKLKNKELEDELFKRRALPGRMAELQAELGELAKAYDALTVERDRLYANCLTLDTEVDTERKKTERLEAERTELETNISSLKTELASANAEIAALKAELTKAEQLKPYLDVGLSPEQLKALASGDTRKLRERLRSKSDELEKANRRLNEARDKAATAYNLAERRQREIDRLLGGASINQPSTSQPEAG